MASWLSWLERRPVTAEVAGSSPAGVVYYLFSRDCTTFALTIPKQMRNAPHETSLKHQRFVIDAEYASMIPYGVLAQLGEHLPYKQRVIGSSPIGPIYVHVWRNRQTQGT